MIDRMLSSLANEHRRRLLVTLLERDPREDVPVPEGVHVGEWEREQLHAEMVHVHLPELEEGGFVRWDRDANAVSRGPNFEEILPLLELLVEHADELPGDWL